MFNEKFLVLLVIALIVIGPQRLPEYAENLGRWVRQLRDMAWDARDAMRAELGPEFEEVDWTKYDPRRYDPRRIVRDALLEPPERDESGGSTAVAALGASAAATGRHPEDGRTGAAESIRPTAAVEPTGQLGTDEDEEFEPVPDEPLAAVVFDAEAT